MKTITIAGSTFLLGAALGYGVAFKSETKTDALLSQNSQGTVLNKQNPSGYNAPTLTKPAVPTPSLPDKPRAAVHDSATEKNAQYQTAEQITTSDEYANELSALKQANNALNSEVASLKTQLDKAKIVIELLNGVGDSPEGMAKSMKETFKSEQRNEQWASDLELKLNDFIYNQGLSNSIKLDQAQCKSSMCRIEFSILPEVEFSPYMNWQTVLGKLRAQPWWYQFSRTQSRSNDTNLTLWAQAREKPASPD